MRVLVTGGTGFLGSRVVARLREAAVPSRARGEDLRDPEVARRFAGDADLLVHLAGSAPTVDRQQGGTLIRDHLLPCLNVLDVFRGRRFVLASSAAVYSDEAPLPHREEDGHRGPPGSAYAHAKRMQEVLVQQYAEERGFEAVILRLANLYGPGGRGVIPDLAARAATDPLTVWGDGTATRTFLHVDDAARGVLLACERAPAGAVLNLASDEEITIADLALLVVEATGTGATLRFDPSKPAGRPRSAMDTARARKVIGFEAEIPLREGLAWLQPAPPPPAPATG